MSEQTAQRANFQTKEVCKLLNFIQEHPSEESDALTAIVLKMAVEFVCQKTKATDSQR